MNGEMNGEKGEWTLEKLAQYSDQPRINWDPMEPRKAELEKRDIKTHLREKCGQINLAKRGFVG